MIRTESGGTVLDSAERLMLLSGLRSLRRDHQDEGDPYHSCAVTIWEHLKKRGKRPECNCGADLDNATIDALLMILGAA